MKDHLFFAICTIAFSCFAFSPALAETPPEPEYPYPKTRKRTLDVEQPESVDSRGGYQYNRKNKRRRRQPYKGVEQPTRIGDDGSFYYEDTKKSHKKPLGGVEQPIDFDDSGAYYYRRNKSRKPKNKPNRYGEQPSKIMADGSYLYGLEKEETRNYFAFRGGVFGTPNVKTSDPSVNFENVYGSQTNFVLNLDYDWRLWKDIDLRLSSGLATFSGSGRFINPPPGLTTTPRESYTFYLFPNTVSLNYKLRLTKMFVPYVDAGLGYFTFIETRSDGERTSFGGAPVANAAAGLLISLSQWQEGSTMQSDYGVTDTWLDLQFKQIFGLDERKDFSSTMITGGFAVGFE